MAGVDRRAVSNPLPVGDLPRQLDLDGILRRVRLRCARRARWLRSLWGAVDGADVGRASVDLVLQGADDPGEEARWHAEQSDDGLADLEAQLQESGGPFVSLRELFGLTQLELDTLQLGLALRREPSMERVLGFVEENAGITSITEAGVRRLFGHPPGHGALARGKAARWGLLRDDGRGWTLDPPIASWLEGGPAVGPELAGRLRRVIPQPPLSSWPVADVVKRVERGIERGLAVRLYVHGPVGSGRRTFAAAVARSFGIELVVVAADQGDPHQLWRRAHRLAWLDRVAPCWVGEEWRSVSVPGLVPFPLEVVVGEVPVDTRSGTAGIELSVELPRSTSEERAELWRRLVPGFDGWESERLVARANAGPGEIARVGRRGARDPAEAEAILQEGMETRLAPLATPLKSRISVDDVVLPAPLATALDDFCYEASEHARIWEDTRLRQAFPQGRGLVALFAGPPGTGKTMAAQAVACSLGLPIFRIQLSAVVSKYIGETSKNLQRILVRAEHMDAVLLFDEADTLFAKRTDLKDAHDRYANADTNHLLQAIEGYRGIAILATNQKGHIDAAFVRRVRYFLDFPKPSVEARARIWRRVLERTSEPESTLLRFTDRLAAGVEVTGSQIQFAVLAALVSARREGSLLRPEHLLRGLDRELAKESRLLTERERERLLHG